MTISTETRRAGPYSGNGSTQVFAFSFKTFAAADLQVVTTTSGVDTVKTLTTHYTVSLNADQNASPGGSITMLTAPATGTTLTIISDRAFAQTLNVQNAGAFLPDAINTALDTLVVQTTQLLDQQDRSLRGALSDAAWDRLPPASARAGGLLGFDSVTGQPEIADFGTVEALAADINTVAAMAADIAIVADADLDIGTVADNITDVTTVADWIGTGGGVGAAEVTSTGSTTPRTLADRFGDVANAFDFGALGNNSANDTAALTSLLAEDDIFIPEGTYLVDGLVLLTGNKRIRGAGMGRTIIKLANAANDHVLFAEDISDIELEGITFDGNKTNQSVGTGNDWRGIYRLGASQRWRMTNVEVKNAVDHGFMWSDAGVTSDECGKDDVIVGCIATGCGSSAHQSGGGSGGTGFAGPAHYSARMIACQGRDNWLNGFKGLGTYVSCHSESNDGGGFETGFSTPEYKKVVYIGCQAIDNGGDGFRHLGQADEIIHLGCTISGNDNNGITFCNGVVKGTAQGCFISNNGQAGTGRSTTVGLDGIGILSSSTTGPSQIILSGNQIWDDQGSPTQEYGFYVDDGALDLIITNDNQVQGNLNGPLILSSAAKSDTLRIGAFNGSTVYDRNTATQTVTGTTSSTDMMSHVLSANEQFTGRSVSIFASGTASGTNGTKTVRLSINGNTTVVASEAAGDQQDWACRIRLTRIGSVVWCEISTFEEAGSSFAIINSYSISAATDITVTFSGQLGNSSDTITQTSMLVNGEM
jgi:hypothetical protein